MTYSDSVAVIGNAPARLSVTLTSGEVTETSWTRRTSRIDPTPLAWTDAPVLHLPGGVSVTAALTAVDAVSDACATFTVAAAQTATVAAAIPDGAGEASVTVGGRTMFAGRVTVL